MEIRHVHEWLGQQCAKAADEWFRQQGQSHFAQLFLYYRRGELTVAEVSGLVGVSGPTVIRLIRVGRLSASQACPGAPWIIRQSDVDAYLARQADSGPQSADPNQLSIDLQ